MPPYANCPRHWSRSAEDARLLGQVIDYYHETLKQSPEALDYLEKRGIADAEAIGRFKLGFANRGPGLSAAGEEPQGGSGDPGPVAAHRPVAFLPDTSTLAGSLVIPVIDPQGADHRSLWRKLNDHLRQGHAAAPPTCRGRIKAYSMSKPCKAPRRLSSANR